MTKTSDALPNIGAPATRALAAIGVTRLSQLSRMAEATVADLHGVGPKAVRILREALAAQGLSFADEGESKTQDFKKAQSGAPAPARANISIRETAPRSVNASGPNADVDVDAYLAKLPADKQAALQKLRRQIHAAAPGAVETMSYGIPTFKLHGKMLVSIGAAKEHCALYGGAGEVVAAHADALKNFSLSKGAIRFTPKKPIPAALVKNLIKTRVAQIEASASSAKKRKG